MASQPYRLNRRAALRLFAGAAAGVVGYAGVDDLEVSGASPFPFDPPGELANSKRKVFAHWHFFPISFDNRHASNDYFSREFLGASGSDKQPRAFGPYASERPLPRSPRAGSAWLVDDLEQDIRWAEAIGIDAFIFNVINIDARSDFWLLLPKALAAAGRVGGAFRIIPNLDASILKNQDVDEVAAALISVGNHPMWFKARSGELVLGAFMAESWPVEKWRRLFAALSQADMRVQFLPTFLNVREMSKDHIELGATISEWGGDYLAAVPAVQMLAAYVKAFGKRWCAPVWPQDVRPKEGVFTEAANSRLFRADWQSAIDSDADDVQIITWNDYSEGSEIRPSTGIQYSFYDLAAFYIAWFKTVRQPRIIRDVLYYFHRVEPFHGRRNSDRQKNDFTLVGGGRKADEIELLAFLTKPGELEIELNGKITRTRAPDGVSALYAPLALGRPTFRLMRDNQIVLEFSSAFVISAPGDYQDLLYRGGSSARAIARQTSGQN